MNRIKNLLFSSLQGLFFGISIGYILFNYGINKNYIFIYEYHNFNMFIILWLVLNFFYFQFKIDKAIKKEFSGIYRNFTFENILVFTGISVIIIRFIAKF